mmetsp:Transcript_10595/g.21877  ORF Transcript_10595/g.21877 Transcript_10595/m.21877 type:complete len:145 (-) Transcript_10595:165-599(-)
MTGRGVATTLRVVRAMSGQLVCRVVVGAETTVLQLKERIHASTGIPVHTQRLLLGTDELERKGQLVSEVFAGRGDPEVALVLRDYQRREMQAAWLIEGMWRRRRGQPTEEAAERQRAGEVIAAAWRARRGAHPAAAGEGLAGMA